MDVQGLADIAGHLGPAIAGGAGGIITAWVTQRVLHRRALFTYFVNHQRAGISTDDPIFGSVAVTWNGNPVPNLYMSTIEMRNESLNDYENVVIRAYTDDTMLLSESTQLLDSPYHLQWTDAYKAQLHVDAGSAPTDVQRAIYGGQREYLVPVLNRGQRVRMTFLNSAKTAEQPNIWLAATKLGVRLIYRMPQTYFLGVPQPQAALYGVASGVVMVGVLAWFVTNPWIVASCSLSYGLLAQFPGAYLYKLFARLRDVLGG